MPKHAAPRTRSPFWTITAGAVAAGVIVTGTLGWATMPTVQGAPHAAIPATQHDAAGVIEACWSEPKPNDAAEQMCGSVNLAPANAYGFRSLEQARADQQAANEAYCDAAAERDYTTGVADPVADHRCAAMLIEGRLQAGGQVYEDFTWQGMPAVVAEQNDRLVTEYTAYATAQPDAADVDEFLGWIADGYDLAEL